MLKTTEEQFYQKIQNIINDLCSESKKLYYDEDKHKLVFIYYKEFRKRIHEPMNSYKSIGEDIKMDRHKVATAFFCSILKAKPIGYNADGIQPNFLERTANKQLGLLFGLYIIYIFSCSESKKSPLGQEISNLEIQLPICENCKDTDYMTNFVELFSDEKIEEYLDFNHSNFNINFLFFLSHLFFMLDSFSFYKNYFILNEQQLQKPGLKKRKNKN